MIAAVAEERMWIGTLPPVDVAARAARIRTALADGSNASFVLERDGAIAGEITLWGIGASSIGMCVAADLRGRGWGGVLLDAAIAHAYRKGRAVLSLGVYAHNVAARRLYDSRGFVAVREAKPEVRLDGETFEVIAMQRLMAGPSRRAVIERVADALCARPRLRRVAIDGTDGAGKTCFANELAYELMRRGQAVIRASVDDFHHPRATGCDDPVDYDALRRELLEPFGPGGTGRYRRAIYDSAADEPVEDNDEIAPPESLLLLDGRVLHRAELRPSWDASIVLVRDAPGSRDDTASRASIVIDNTRLNEPRIVRA